MRALLQTLLGLSAGCGRLAFDARPADAMPDAPLLDPVGQLDPAFGVLQPSSTTESIAFDVVMRGDGMSSWGRTTLLGPRRCSASR